MKTSVNSSIHNRFDIYVNDKQVAYAENIVLNQMYNQLCARSAYFANIHFGTGTGTLSASRTSLFTHLGTKTAVNDAQSKVLPTSYWRQKIVLNPEEYVGSALSEVGVAYGATSTNLVTHALIKDMNGNVITLTKTALDVVTIYATVYVTFSTSNASLQLCGFPNSNQLVNYLIGGATFPNHYFYTGEADYADTEFTTGILSDPKLGQTAALTWTSDVANKRTYSSTPRLQVGDSNGHIAEVVLGGTSNPTFRLVLPTTGIYSGLPIVGASVGTGDGATSRFLLPSRNVNQTGITVKIDGVETTAYTKEVVCRAINFKRNVPTGGAGDNSTGCSLSSDGLVLAVVSIISPFVVIHDWVGGVWVRRADPVNLPADDAYSCALSSDGLVLAVAHSISPYITTYDWTAGAWIKRTNPAVLPTGTGRGCALSADGLILAVAHYTLPYITTYDWTAGAWIKRADPATALTGAGYGCALTPDGLVLAVANSSSPYITTYDWTAGAWIKRADPAVLPTGAGYGCALTPDGLVLAVANSSSPYITTYDWTAGAWIKRTNPAVLPTGNGQSCALTPDGLVLAVAHYTLPYITTYDWTDEAWVKRANPATALTGNGQSCSLSSDGTVLALMYSMAPFVAIYDLQKRQTEITFTSPPAVGAVITADYTVNGIHKTTQRVIDLYAEITFGEVT